MCCGSFWVDVERARGLVERGGFVVVTHGGFAHGDDLLAMALWRDAGAPVYRLNTVEEVLAVEGDVILVDIGDSFRDRLPPRFVVLDHHGSPDEPSSIVQTMLALRFTPPPAAATHVHFVDLFDRLGPRAKSLGVVYGQSLILGLAKYVSDAVPRGLVSEDRFLGLLAEALRSRLEPRLEDYAGAFAVAEKLRFASVVEEFPRTFALLRLMLRASRSVLDAVLSREAFEVGFGVDFGAFALLAVPELEPYLLRGLESFFAEAWRAAELARSGRYVLLGGGVAAVAVDEVVRPASLWSALVDLGVLSPDSPVVVVVRDVRTPGGFVVWRPDTRPDIDLRRLEGGWVVFRHANGFMAVVRAQNAEEAAKLVQGQLTRVS